MTRWLPAFVASSIGSVIEGSSFSSLFTRVEISHMRIKPAGNGRASRAKLGQRSFSLSIFDRYDAQFVEFGAKEIHIAILREQKPRNRAVRKGGLEIEADLQAGRKSRRLPSFSTNCPIPSVESEMRNSRSSRYLSLFR